MIYTSRNSKIVFSVNGLGLDNKSWDKFSGGGRTSDTQNYPAGGMVPSVAVAGVTKRSTATLERVWDDTLISAYLALDGAVNASCSVTVTPLQSRTTAAAHKRTFTGIVKEVTPPESDSTSSNVQMLSLVLELNETMSG